MQVDEKGTVLKPRQSAEDNLATLLATLSGAGSCQTNTQGGCNLLAASRRGERQERKD